MPKCMKCPGCGAEVAGQARGRPRTYCGTVCRRNAEYDLRRAQSLLTRAQRKLQDAELRVSIYANDEWRLKRERPPVEYWRAEVARLQVDMRALLAGISSDTDEAQEGA